jgi:hypothetical protein
LKSDKQVKAIYREATNSLMAKKKSNSVIIITIDSYYNKYADYVDSIVVRSSLGVAQKLGGHTPLDMLGSSLSGPRSLYSIRDATEAAQMRPGQ